MKKSAFYIFAFMFLITLCDCNSTRNKQHSNAGEQELAWAREFFRKNYRTQDHERYKGNVLIKDDTLFYSESYIIFPKEDTLLFELLKGGLLYPEKLGGENFTLGPLEEIGSPFIKRKHLKRRYMIYVWSSSWPKLANPYIYYIEISVEGEDYSEAPVNNIDEVELTFIAKGGVVI